MTRILARSLLAAALLLALSGHASAQTSSPPIPDHKLTGHVDAGVGRHLLTDPEKDWWGAYLRGAVETDRANTWLGEVVYAERFGDTGTFFSVGNTHIFTEDWYSAVAVGGSSGGFFWPRFRIDAFFNRKWLEQRNLVTSLGVGYYDAKDVHHDYSLSLGATYYFEAPWIVEGGIRFNLSEPGSVKSTSQFIAVTYGRNKQHYVVGRYGFGREAYQVVGPSEVITDFYSRVVSLTWRQWIGRDWGLNAMAEHYRNPFYERNGVEVGIFVDF